MSLFSSTVNLTTEVFLGASKGGGGRLGILEKFEHSTRNSFKSFVESVPTVVLLSIDVLVERVSMTVTGLGGGGFFFDNFASNSLACGGGGKGREGRLGGFILGGGGLE